MQAKLRGADAKIAGLALAACLAVLLLWGGCRALPFVGGSGEPSSTLQLQVQGEPEMNSGGNAAVVRVYQLSGPTNFKQTPLPSFWKDDEQALGGDLVSAKEMLLYPGESKALALAIDGKASYVGIAADLRSPAREQWRALRSLRELEDRSLTTTVMADRVEVDVR